MSARLVRMVDWLGRPIAVNPEHVVSVETTEVEGRCDLSLVASAGHQEELTVRGTFDEIVALLNGTPQEQLHQSLTVVTPGWERQRTLSSEYPVDLGVTAETEATP